MTLYRKRPVVVEAFQMTRKAYRNKASWPHWLPSHIRADESWWDGGWYVRGDNAFYDYCKPDIFAATYEAVEEETK